MKRILGLCLLLGLVVPVVAQEQNQPRKKRVAVMDFDYGTVRSAVAALFGTDVDIGNGMAALLVKHLVQDGTYSVIERKMLDKVLAEQNFSTSDRANPASAAQIGKILGLDAMIVGTITQFGGDDRNTRVGGGGGGWRGFGVGGVGSRSSKAIVGVDVRVIDIDTAEILAVADGKGESKRSGLTLLGAGGGRGGWGAGGIDMSSSNFQETIIGEAVHAAMQQVASNLIAAAPKVKARTIIVEGMVAFVEGDTVVLNVGSKAGVRVGDTLSVERVTSEIKDPATGQVIRRMTSKLGTVQVTEVDEGSSVARIVTGSGFQVGDAVKTVTQ